MSDQPDIVTTTQGAATCRWFPDESDLNRRIDAVIQGVAKRRLDDAMAEIRQLQELVYDYAPTEFAPDGVTWKQTANQLRADNAVLAAEVRAWRVLFSSASKGAGNWFKNRKEADQQMAKTDASGALERDGGGA